MEREINNTTVITHIEKLLPTNVMRDWALIRQKIVNNDEIFNRLMIFLLNERSIIEYIEESIRKGPISSKVNVSNVNMEENNDSNHSECSTVIQKMQCNQEIQNKQFTDCLNNLTFAFNNSVQSSNKTPSPINSNFGASNKWCIFHNTQNHDLSSCITFKRLDKFSKLDFIKRNGMCFSCLLPGHMSGACDTYKLCNVSEQYGVCNKNHHPILHEIFKSNNSFVNSQSNTIRQSGNVTQTKRGNGCLLPIGTVKCKNYNICTLYDCGADLSLMTHHLAKYLNFKGF